VSGDAIVLRGGRVIACDPKGTIAEAIAIADGRVLAVGSADDVAAAVGQGARSVDLDGATVLPGLVDTHPHVMHFGVFAEPLVDLAEATDHEDIAGRVAAKVAETDPGEWVMTTPVGEPHYFIRRSWRDLAEGELPGREVLDRAAPDNPVAIQAWAPTTPNVMALNSAGLERLGINSETPDRVGNVWIEKGAGGEPTGVLTGSVNNYYSNEPFTEELMRQLPLLDPAAIGPGTERSMAAFNAMGVTCGYEGHAMDFPLIAAYGWLRGEGKLTMRVLCAPEAEPYGLPWNENLSDEEFGERLEQAAGMVERSDELLRIDGLTIGRGGPCGPGLLLMREPYAGPYGEETAGVSFVSAERAERALRFAHDRGLRLNIVTAGTGEHDEYLEVLEALAESGPLAAEDRAWLLQHLYFVEPDQARRIAALDLDVTTSMSFSWGKGELVRDRIGEEMLEHLIPLKRLLDAGLHVGCGSDWGPKNVFEQIALAVEPTYAGSGAAAPTPGVTREQALAMWTSEAAHVLRWEDIGSLETGHRADLCIVDRDPLGCPIEDLPATKVLTTVLGGEAVHGQL
jgi:predicted amidohydrolase YtcJ